MRLHKKILSLVLLAASFFASPPSARADETRYITPNILTIANGGFANQDDAVSAAVPIGFTFRFAGTDYTTVQMSTNAVLYFANGDGAYTNSALSARTGNPGVYALWDDLTVGLYGNTSPDENLSRALYYTAGTAGSRVFIMQWTNWYSYNETYEVGTFNVVLHEGSNVIDVYYRNMLGSSPTRQYGMSATIGLAAANGYTSQYSMDSPVATEGKFLTYTPSANGASPYTLQDRTVTAATTAALQTYFLSYTTSPKIPVNLSAAPSTPNATSATLTWDLSALGAAPTAYSIRYSTSPQMTGFSQTSSFTTPGTYTLPGLSAGTTYYWQVVATIGALTSVSTTSSFTQVVNHAPVAVDGSFSTSLNTAYSGTLSATDIDNTPNTSGLIYSIVTQPASGNVAITNSATGAYTFTPANGFSGPLSFTFKAFDGTSYSNLATVSITVAAGATISVEQPAGSALAYSPAATVDFGSVGLSSTVSTKTFTIKNTGSVSLTSSGVVIGGTNAADFTITSNAVFPIAASGSSSVTVTFSPTGTGARSATLSVPSNDSSHTPFVVNLTGTGTTIATLVMSTGAPSYIANTAAVVIDPALVLTGTGNLTGATVSITSNLASGLDVLGFVDQLGITGSYNSSSGILTLSGTASMADYQTVLRTVTFASSSPSTATRTFTFAVGQSLFNPVNGHSYEYISAPGIQWAAARDAAAARTYFGMQGYLVTVTSAAEQAFVETKLQGQGWMGASDQATEGEWYWVTGPEAGTQFWHGTGSGNTVGGQYSHWSSGEPNNAGNENYAHFLSGGMWNDYAYNNPSIQGYVVEYGGTGGDPLLQLTGTRNITVSFPAPILSVEQPLGTSLSYNPVATVDFGTVGLSSTISSKTFTLKNNGTANMTTTGVVVTGANAADYLITSPGTFPVAPGGSTTITVLFSPSAAGPRAATLNIPSNDTARTPFLVSLTGSGTTIATLLTTAGGVSYTVNTPAVVVDPSLVITGTGTLTGASVSITGNFVANLDLLSFTPQGSITGSYNAASGILTLSGTGTLAEYQAALRSVTFSSSSASAATRSFTFAIGQSLFNPANAHSYEFVSANGIQWAAARDAAAARTYFGMQGYLVTVTSASEQAFVQTKLAGQGWMGASDAANEGEWFWVTGPEAGTQFWHGQGTSGNAVGGQYNNWSYGEPNDAVGGEDYAHFLPGGAWNDYAFNNSSIQGYVVEYGGLPTDPLLQLTGTRSATILVSAIAVHNGSLVTDPAVANGGTVTFGNSVVGTGISRTLNVQNTGTGSLTGLTVTKGGSNPGDFIASVIAAPVAANGSTTFTVMFTPLGVGTRTAVLHIASNDPNTNPFDINVSGVGIITLDSVSAPAAGTYKESSVLTFTATYSHPVTVSGVPSLDFIIGTTLRHATYVSGSGTNTLTFTYTVVSADIDEDGIVIQSPLSLNGGAILDPAGNLAPRAFTPPSTANVKIGGAIYFTSTVNEAPSTTTGSTSVGIWESIRSGMVIAGNGALAFRAHLDLNPSAGVTVDNFQGIWKSPLGTSASTVLVTRSGSVAPDVGNALYDVLPDNPYINNSSQLTFVGFLRVNTGTPAVTVNTDSGVWSELGGAGLHKVLREGEAAAGGTVSVVSPSGWIATSDAGLASFGVKLTNGGSALLKTTASAGSFPLSTVAKAGDAAPTVGGAAASTFDALVGNSCDPRMNPVGDLAFYANLTNGGTGIWYQPAAGSLSAVVRNGIATPGLADTFYGLDRPSLSSGTIFFRAFLTNIGQSIWKGNPATPASLTAIAKTGDTAISGVPAGSQLWSLWAPFSNVNAKVAFRASLLSSASVETRAIVTDTDGTLKVIAKVGDTAPGTGGQTFTNFDNPVIGDGNQTAFVASTSGGIVGIFRQAANGGALKLLLSIGDTVNAGGVDEIIAQIIVPGGASADRMSEVKTVDAAGRVLAHVTYQSGKTGILLTSP